MGLIALQLWRTVHCNALSVTISAELLASRQQRMLSEGPWTAVLVTEGANAG